MATSTPSHSSMVPVREKVVYDLSDMAPWREFAVILFNDEEHSMPEVTLQLMKALRCAIARAQSLMLTVHNTGRATVAIVARPRAFTIAKVLREIDLRVSLRQLN